MVRHKLGFSVDKIASKMVQGFCHMDMVEYVRRLKKRNQYSVNANFEMVNGNGGYISGVEVSQYYQQWDVPYQCVESLSDIEC